MYSKTLQWSFHILKNLTVAIKHNTSMSALPVVLHALLTSYRIVVFRFSFLL